MRPEMELNRRHWDEAAEFHTRNESYGLTDFLAGKCQLFRIEVEELGDVSGKSLLHLQCHFGLDTLSWARRGARVTGVDFSRKAIDAARDIAAKAKLDATFLCSDLYALRDMLDAPAAFDIVFTSYGVLCWLPDLTRWAQTIAHYLKPGGIFYIAEAHPFARVFPMNDDVSTAGAEPLKAHFGYFHDAKGQYWAPCNDYCDTNAQHTAGEHAWQHSMADIVNALIGAGLTIEWLHEFPLIPWNMIAGCEHKEPHPAGRFWYWGLPDDKPQLPLMFSIRARKH